METEQKFATFISDASGGRKLGAVMSILAALVLTIAIFVPSFNFGVPIIGDFMGDDLAVMEENVPELMSEQAKLVDEILTGKNISVVSYLIKYDPAVQSVKEYVETGEPSNSSGLVGILLFVLLMIFIMIGLVCALYTINAVCFMMTVCSITEIILVYLLRFKSAFATMLVGNGELGFLKELAGNLTIHMGFGLIILLFVAGILQIVGLILHYAMRDKNEEQIETEEYWTDGQTEGRDLETGLTGDNAETDFDMEDKPEEETVAATLVQMNTGKKFVLPDNSERVLGKGTQVDIIIPNPVVSREHAKISCSAGRCVLKDLGSKNGTFLNERQLRAGESVQLTSGDYITLGNEILKFKK